VVHEWALAEAVIKSLEGVSGEVKLVRVILGELQNVDGEILLFALEELKKGTRLEGAKFELEVEPAEFECNACNARWKLSEVGVGEAEKEAMHFVPELAHAFLRCPSCGSPDFKVVKGRGVKVEPAVR
jgi:hydrogenase nickel incorporation protein HypA/HybF